MTFNYMINNIGCLVYIKPRPKNWLNEYPLIIHSFKDGFVRLYRKVGNKEVNYHLNEKTVLNYVITKL